MGGLSREFRANGPTQLVHDFDVLFYYDPLHFHFLFYFCASISSNQADCADDRHLCEFYELNSQKQQEDRNKDELKYITSSFLKTLSEQERYKV